VVVATLLKRIIVLGSGLLSLFAATIAICVRLIPYPHGRLQYMVAGAVATAVTLATGFAVLGGPNEKRPVIRIRIARRSGQSS